VAAVVIQEAVLVLTMARLVVALVVVAALLMPEQIK
jgi:hypothetical protein